VSRRCRSQTVKRVPGLDNGTVRARVDSPSKGCDRGGWPCSNGGYNERVEAFGDRLIGFREEMAVAVEREAGGGVSGSTRHLKGARPGSNPEGDGSVSQVVWPEGGKPRSGHRSPPKTKNDC
jgi:hypothetical protein